MAIVQDTYNNAPARGYAGMVVNGETANVISRAVEDAAGIAFGKAAFRGTGDHGATATATAGALLGFVQADHGMVILPGGTADVVPQYREANIRTLGAICVIAGEAVTDNAQVYITAGGAIVDTVGSNIIAPGWFFDETVASGAPVRIVRR